MKNSKEIKKIKNKENVQYKNDLIEHKFACTYRKRYYNKFLQFLQLSNALKTQKNIYNNIIHNCNNYIFNRI